MMYLVMTVLQYLSSQHFITNDRDKTKSNPFAYESYIFLNQLVS